MYHTRGAHGLLQRLGAYAPSHVEISDPVAHLPCKVREGMAPRMETLGYDLATLAVVPSDIEAVTTPMFWLMFRNIASDGFVFQDPIRPGVLSQPGCILASPSWENSTTHVRQDYVYHWTRDAAIVAFELAADPLPTAQSLIDYVHFSRACQTSPGDFDRASFLIDGTKRDWSDQSDGPAIQTLAVLDLYDQLDGSTQQVARDLIEANLTYLQNAYRNEMVNLWEEEKGQSFSPGPSSSNASTPSPPIRSASPHLHGSPTPSPGSRTPSQTIGTATTTAR
jgi:hypothetical protein